MNKIKKFLIGIKEFEIAPNYNSEYVQRKIQEEKQRSGILFFGFRIDYYADVKFQATYKFGKGLATSLNGEIFDESIIVTCKPHKVMIVFLAIIIISVCMGVYFISEAGTSKLTGIFLLILGMGLYLLMVFLIQRVHKISIDKLLSIINGGSLKEN